MDKQIISGDTNYNVREPSEDAKLSPGSVDQQKERCESNSPAIIVNDEINDDAKTNVQNGCNPTTEDIDEIDLTKLAGDRIGTTMYSERFVLKTLLKFQENEWNEELESDLCDLWDMTTDNEVVEYLVEHDFFTIAAHALGCDHWPPRCLEIITGMIANVSVSEKAVKKMFEDEDVIKVFIRIIFNDFCDALTLVQYMRFLNLIYRVEDNVFDIINRSMFSNENFMDTFSNMLAASQCRDLIINMIETLSVVTFTEVYKKQNVECVDLFLNTTLIQALYVALTELFNNKNVDFWEYYDNFVRVLTTTLSSLENIGLARQLKENIDSSILEDIKNKICDIFNILSPFVVKVLNEGSLFLNENAMAVFDNVTSICESFDIIDEQIFKIVFSFEIKPVLDLKLENDDEMFIKLKEFFSKLNKLPDRKFHDFIENLTKEKLNFLIKIGAVSPTSGKQL